MDKESLINGYFEGTLSEAEMIQLEQLRSTDPEFAELFNFESELQLSLKKQERVELRHMFHEVRDASLDTAPRVLKLRPWLAAASITLMLAVGSWLYFQNMGMPNPDQLYNTNFEPYENVVHPIERGSELESLKDEAFGAYEQGEYEKALALFRKLAVEDADPYIDFYSAIVYMQLNDHKKAIGLLQRYKAASGALTNRANWYLALSYLKTGELEPSKELLRTVVSQKGFKSEAATRILRSLE